MIRNKNGRAKKILLLAFLAFVICLPLIMINYSYGVMICCFIEIYIIATSGFDILWGYSGQISMGHAGFYAIGAYGTVLLNKFFGVPVLLGMVIASILACGIGALLAYPASKLRYAFLSLATIAFNEIIYQVIIHSPGGITGDFLGLFAEPISIFGFEFGDYTAFYYLGLVFVILFILAKLGLVNSRVGRALQAVKQNPHAAEGMGVNARKYKVIAFAVSAFYCAFAGGMYASLAGYISPDTFQRTTSVQFLVMLLLGGSCSVAGSIIGSTAILIMNEFLRSAQQYQLLVYGAIILLVIMVMPRGILGEATALIKKLVQKKEEKFVNTKGGVGNA